MKKPVIAPEHRPYLIMLILALATLGILLAAWRHATASKDGAAAGDHLWDLGIEVQVRGNANRTTVELALPLDTRFLRTIAQHINHSGWKQTFRHKKVAVTGRASKIVLTATRDGRLTIGATFSILQSALPGLGQGTGNKTLEPAARERYLQDHPLLQIGHEMVRATVERLREQALGASLPEVIYRYTRELKWRKGPDLLEVPEILAGHAANARERAYTMVALARAAGIPARLVRGFILEEAPQASPHFWVELYDDRSWLAYDPVWGYRQEVPSNYLPMVKGLGEVVAVRDATDYSVSYSIQNTDALLDVAESSHHDWQEILDLTRLPLETRQMLAALMLFPFGILLTAALLQITGIRAYGVFTPALIATSLSYVPWESAAAILTIVLAVGVLGRSIMPGELPRPPRMAIVVTLVVLGLTTSASLMEYFEVNTGGALVLLPIVVLTSLVDRFYSVLDEKGWHAAMIRLGWTLALSALCLPVVQYEPLGDLLTRYPELHLVTLAAILTLSLYRGKQLTELATFGWLNGPAEKKPANRE